MSHLFSIKFDAESRLFHIGGELSLNSASALLEEADALFESVNELELDFATVVRSDSAGLALLIAWMRKAKQQNKPIQFHNLPAQMLAIASASGLDEFLPVS